jgi:hypothetical protein
LISWRPRVTLSKINPQAKESNAHTIIEADKIAVGNRGTIPAFRYSKTTGIEMMIETVAIELATIPKKNVIETA